MTPLRQAEGGVKEGPENSLIGTRVSALFLVENIVPSEEKLIDP